MPRLRFHFDYTLPATAAELWPLFSDTERLNRRLGLPVTTAKATGTEPVRVAQVRPHLGPVALDWVEEPFDFVEPQHFWVQRRLRAGPIREFNGGARFEPVDGGCRVFVESEFVPAGLPGTLLVRALVRKVRADWDRLIVDVTGALARREPLTYGHGVDETRPAERAAIERRLRDRAPDLLSRPHGERLAQYLACQGDTQLNQIRPFSLAAAWQVDRYEVLGLCLQAVKQGWLDLSWDLLCPNCRGARSRWTTLTSVRDRAHCDDCQIQFDGNFDRALEVTFRPNPSVREVEQAVYCSGGPRNTPHILAQCVLSSGQDREWRVVLGAGRYRLRNLTADLAALLTIDGEPSSGGAVDAVDAVLHDDRLECSAAVLGPGEVNLRLANRTTSRQQVVLERILEHEERATAAVVSAYQEFRDLFSSELLAPDTQLGIQTLPLLFTDLKGSTALYGRLGDAAAYALVRDHFRLLQELVGRHGGGVIKTIGDAVMAAFPTGRTALAAALEIHRDLAKFNQTSREPLGLKVGLHQGPCIAVRSYDERLDYFGGTVNLAARTHELSSGRDVVVTDALWTDPEIRGLLDGLPSETEVVDLRGIGPTRIHRLRMVP